MGFNRRNMEDQRREAAEKGGGAPAFNPPKCLHWFCVLQPQKQTRVTLLTSLVVSPSSASVFASLQTPTSPSDGWGFLLSVTTRRRAPRNNMQSATYISTARLVPVHDRTGCVGPPARPISKRLHRVCANKPWTRLFCRFWKLKDLLCRDRKLARPALECLHFWQVADWRHRSRETHRRATARANCKLICVYIVHVGPRPIQPTIKLNL